MTADSAVPDVPRDSRIVAEVIGARLCFADRYPNLGGER